MIIFKYRKRANLVNNVNRARTRNQHKKNLKIENFTTKKMENSPWIRGATLWNNLEKDTQLIDEKEIFKAISKNRFIPKLR